MRKLRRTFVCAALAALGCSNSDCVTPPCPSTVAMVVSVTSIISGLPISGATVQLVGSTAIPCNQPPGSTCSIPGGVGTYELDVSAPGFQTMHRTVVVTGTAPACGCGTVNTENVTVGLVPAATSKLAPPADRD